MVPWTFLQCVMWPISSIQLPKACAAEELITHLVDDLLESALNVCHIDLPEALQHLRHARTCGQSGEIRNA